VKRHRLSHKYRQQWDALPRERKVKIIEEAIAVEEEYQVCTCCKMFQTLARLLLLLMVYVLMSINLVWL